MDMQPPDTNVRQSISIVGIGGTTRPGSTSERAMELALQGAAELGASTRSFGGTALAGLPIYSPEDRRPTEREEALVEAVRAADGLVVASPGYHGGVSGMVKNALDLFEDLREDRRPYLHGRAVGCIVAAYGWQACGTTLVSLRSTVHALRGWPTPFGAALNSSGPIFDRDGFCADRRVADQLRTVGEQVVEFARLRHGSGPSS